LNVLRGEMSLVGPRPEDERYVRLYSPAERMVLSMRPGITSPVSVRYRREEELLAGPDFEKHYVDVLMHEKLAQELEYLENRSFLSDVATLLRSIFTVIG